MFYDEPLDFEKLPAGAKLVRIPLSGEWALAAAYILRHPQVEELIAKQEWKAQPLGPF